MNEKKINFAILFLCWITYPFQRRKNSNRSQIRYEYYSVIIRSVSATTGDVFKEYNRETTSNNVRRNLETDVWEVFRRKYGTSEDSDYHQGMNGTWEILDADKIEIIKKSHLFKTPELAFD